MRNATHRLAATDPNAPTRVPLPPDPTAALAAICKALALPPSADAPTILVAVQALLGVGSDAPAPTADIAANARRLGLSESQVQACVAAKCNPLDFIAARAAMGRTRR